MTILYKLLVVMILKKLLPNFYEQISIYCIVLYSITPIVLDAMVILMKFLFRLFLNKENLLGH